MKPSRHRFDHARFHKMPIIGILRGMDADNLLFILEAFYRAGLNTIEITMNSPEVEDQIKWTKQNYGSKLNIGAGTVRHTGELDRALDAGATFIVTPNVDEAVITRCKERQIPIFSGALTPTEVYQAHNWGAEMIKVFPASVMGPGYIKSLKGPLETIPLIATGGIHERNMIEYLKAGAYGFGIGGTLFDKNLIAEKEWTALTEHMRKFVRIINEWRN